MSNTNYCWKGALLVTLLTTIAFSHHCTDTLVKKSLEEDPRNYNPLQIAYDRCDDISKRSLSSDDFAKTTYWSKVISTLAIRLSTIRNRYQEHSIGLASDLAMVFISPKIKQSIRNQMVKNGNSFSSKTILEYYPQRLGLNLSVSTIDASLAFGTGILETNGNFGDSLSHGVKRFASNGVTYVFLDPLLTGVTDFVVMNRLLPHIINTICKKYSGNYALWLTRGAIAVSFFGVGAGVEAIQFLGVRSFLFNNQDVKLSETSAKP